MLALQLGQNMVLTTAVVDVFCEWVDPARVAPDAVALALGTGRTVASDGDVVFYNQPIHPSGSITVHPGQSQRIQVTVDLGNAPATVDRVVIAIAQSGPGLAGYQGLRATAVAHGHPFARFDLTARSETVLIVCEIYRRDGGWRLRAVGQGYQGGLPDLLGDHGVVVDADPTPLPPPVPLPPGPQTGHPLGPAPATGRPDPARPPSAPPQWTPPVPSSPPTQGGSTPPHHGGQQAPSVQPAPVAAPTTNFTGPGPPPADRRVCPACGERMKRGAFGMGSLECRPCLDRTRQWVEGVSSWLPSAAPAQMSERWRELAHLGLDERRAHEMLRKASLAHLRAVSAFAFADGQIEDQEMALFDQWVNQLRLVHDDTAQAIRTTMLRGQAMTRLENGALPRLSSVVTLRNSEILHAEADGSVYLRRLQSGIREHYGRLLVTNLGVTFAGDSGHQYKWAKVLHVAFQRNVLIVATSTARGTYEYRTPDAQLMSATAIGANRVSKRLIAVGRVRDSRAIPQHIRTAVYYRDGGQCRECGASEYLEFDHDIPYSRGGATSEANLQLLCRRCNLAKGARL